MSYRALESQSNAFAAGSGILRRPAGRSRRAAAAQLSAVLHRAVRHLESRRRLSSRSIQSTRERELEAALASTGALLVVTLTPFYQRSRASRAHAAARRIATSIKEYLPPALRLLFTLFKEKKDGHRISIAADDIWLQASAARAPLVAAAAVDVRPDDRAVILSSGGTTGTPKGVVGLHRHYVAAGRQLYEWTKSALNPWIDPIMLPLPLFHVYANVGVQPLAFVGPHPLSLVPNPRDIDDLLKTIRQVKPAFFNGIPTLYTAILNHPDVRAGQDRPEHHQAVLLRRRGADGRNQAAVRGRNRRSHRGGLFADRRHDGLLREPGERQEQDRIDWPAAPGRRRPHRRRRMASANCRRAKSAS